MRVRLAEVNRYGRYLRAHVRHYNSDSDVCWNHRRLCIKYGGNEVFQCTPTAEAIKNAYCLFRLMSSNLNNFLAHLQTVDGVVPDVFQSATPPHDTEVSVEQDEIVAVGNAL